MAASGARQPREPMSHTTRQETTQEQYYLASQWQLMWRKLRRHRLALAGGTMLLLLYLVAIFAEFCAPHDIFQRHNDFINAPPQPVRVFDGGSVHRPFVYPLIQTRNEVTLRREYVADTTRRLRRWPCWCAPTPTSCGG